MTPQELARVERRLYDRASAVGGRMIYPEEGYGLYEAAHRIALTCGMPVIVEIGSYKGTSTAMLAGGAPNGVVIAIDGHTGLPDSTAGGVETEDSSTIHGMRKTLWACGVEDRVFIIPTFSALAHRSVKTLLAGRPIDLLFVDGGHRYEDAIQDFRLYAPMVRKGGFLIIDDLAYEGVGRAWKDFQDEHVNAFAPVDLRPWGITDGVHKREFEGCLHKMRWYVRT